MDQVCARPGCGHPLRSRKAFEIVGHDAEGCLDEDCPCPSFRTQAQQEAWERLDGVMQGDPELWPELVLDAAEKVWRAYP